MIPQGTMETVTPIRVSCAMGNRCALKRMISVVRVRADSVVDELASWGVDYIKLDGISNSVSDAHR